MKAAFLRKEHWFGVPRWAVTGAVVGIFACIGVYTQPATVSDRVRAVVEGFRHSSVYVQPGAPPVVDPERVRQVLDDRPIVVAIMADEPLPPASNALIRPRQKLCDEIVDLVPTNIVIVFAWDDRRGYGSSFCTGDDFGNADNPVNAKNFDFVLIAAAEVAWKYRVSATDLTPEIEEYVLAFDAQAWKDYPNSVPRRGAVPDELATGEVVLSLGGIVAASVAMFFLLHVLAGRFSRRSRSRSKELALSARLSWVGGSILQGDPQDPAQAEIARKYVLALRALEEGGDAEDRIAELEALVR